MQKYTNKQTIMQNS